MIHTGNLSVTGFQYTRDWSSIEFYLNIVEE